MNTSFRYLYRDGANYKQWGCVVFEGAPEDDHADRIRDACESDKLFIPWQVRVPHCYLFLGDDSWELDPEIDHCWHEFYALEESDDSPEDPHEREIGQLVNEFQRASSASWRVVETREIAEYVG
ncbi:MAG: hypothetical protein ABEL76_14490 [Bradymonadaceae bacterium]